MLQACCMLTAHHMYMHIKYVIWMSIMSFSISQTQWHVLEFCKNPVHAAGTLHPLYMCLKYVNIDVNKAKQSVPISFMSDQVSRCQGIL